jgi:hypothetical protein
MADVNTKQLKTEAAMNFGRLAPVCAGFCEEGDERQVSIKVREFLDLLSDYNLFNNGFCSLEVESSNSAMMCYTLTDTQNASQGAANEM